jgi:HEAT repeat protein
MNQNEEFVDFIGDKLRSEKDIEILGYMAEITVDKNIKNKVSLILPLIQFSDPLLRRHICGLLGNYGDTVAIERLIDKLRTDESVDVRVVSAYALGKIGDGRATADLLWAKDHDFAVDFQGLSASNQATKALNEIERKQESD